MMVRAIDERIRGKQSKQGEKGNKGGTVRSVMNSADARGQGGSEETADGGSAGDNAGDEMQDIVTARRRVAEDIQELAERHRDDVWRRVQERIANQRPKRRSGIFRLFRSRPNDAVSAHATVSALPGHTLAPGLNTASYQLRPRVRTDPRNRPR